MRSCSDHLKEMWQKIDLAFVTGYVAKKRYEEWKEKQANKEKVEVKPISERKEVTPEEAMEHCLKLKEIYLKQQQEAAKNGSDQKSER